MGFKFSDPHAPCLGVVSFSDPQNRQCTNVGHLSTDFHNVKSNFVGFPVC